MRILLTGSQGQVGQQLKRQLSGSNRWDVTCLNRTNLDLTDVDAIAHCIQTIQPHIIINAAAYTAVDRAEAEPDLAYIVNARAPEKIATVAKATGAALIHISTDYVFAGTQSSPYTEEVEAQPLSVYGASKLAGEQAIQSIDGHSLILRTSWLYGSYGKSNFVKTMLRLGAERQELRVVRDQIGSPTYTKPLANAITQLLSTINTIESGIYHYTNSGVASWYDFAVAIVEEGRTVGFPLKVQDVVPITTDEYPTSAPRPAYSVLDCSKISRLFGHTTPHWRVSLREMLQEFYLLGSGSS